MAQRQQDRIVVLLQSKAKRKALPIRKGDSPERPICHLERMIKAITAVKRRESNFAARVAGLLINGDPFRGLVCWALGKIQSAAPHLAGERHSHAFRGPHPLLDLPDYC